MASEPTRKLFAGAGLAALRQGAKEIGTALKPLPDSISIDEIGGPFTPTPGEISSDNKNSTIWGRLQDNRERSLASPAKEAPEPTLDRD